MRRSSPAPRWNRPHAHGHHPPRPGGSRPGESHLSPHEPAAGAHGSAHGLGPSRPFWLPAHTGLGRRQYAGGPHKRWRRRYGRGHRRCSRYGSGPGRSHGRSAPPSSRASGRREPRPRCSAPHARSAAPPRRRRGPHDLSRSHPWRRPRNDSFRPRGCRPRIFAAASPSEAATPSRVAGWEAAGSWRAWSWLPPPADALCCRDADLARLAAGRDGQPADGVSRDIAQRRQAVKGRRVGKKAAQLRLQSRRDLMAVLMAEALEGQTLDMELDALHAHPRTSAPLSGRSRLAASPWAARSRWAMSTGSPASAAWKAALRAMLRILPPAMWSCASRV